MERLTLFSKRPRLGQVKTRMVPPLDARQALELHRAFFHDQVGFVRSLCPTYDGELRMDGPWRPSCTGDPPIEGLRIREQGDGDLGRRLLRAFRGAARDGARGTVVIGADAPTLPASLVHEAFRLLASGAPAVVAPAEDGGYVLLGMRRPLPQLLEGIPWGTPTVLATTLHRANETGVEIAMLETWFDVDDAAGLSKLRHQLRCPTAANRAPATRALLERLDVSGTTVL